jgi:hypothetical protein
MNAERIGRATVAVWLVLATGQLLADGKMFWPEKVPPGIPYQRALILFEGGVETLVLQSQYKVPEDGGKTSIGWVVPVPAPPDVASLEPGAAYRLFWDLNWATQPRITSVSALLALVALAVSVVALVAYLAFLPASRHVRVPQWFASRRRVVGELIVLGFAVSLGVTLLLPSLSTAGAEVVDVVSTQQVGIYDVRVVQSNDTKELIAWLNGNGFAFGGADREAFGAYVSRGWCFVVATIVPSAKEHPDEVAVEGLAAPLILRFPRKQPVYPLALTATGGYDTEILVYLAATQKMTCDERLKLRSAGERSEGVLDHLVSQCEPQGFFAGKLLARTSPRRLFVTKFKGSLTPAEMAEDLVFAPAADDAPYRERVFRW